MGLLRTIRLRTRMRSQSLCSCSGKSPSASVGQLILNSLPVTHIHCVHAGGKATSASSNVRCFKV
jgi:hypothetical protein